MTLGGLIVVEGDNALSAVQQLVGTGVQVGIQCQLEVGFLAGDAGDDVKAGL